MLEEKPEIKLRRALERLYDNYPAAKLQNNELFSQSKYRDIKGFDYNDYVDTISRREPSKVIIHDDVNFEIVWISEMMSYAASPFVPDAFDDTKEGRGITWGMAHFIALDGKGKFHSKLTRFDCDLSLDLHDPEMKEPRVNYTPEDYFKRSLSKKQMERIKEITAAYTEN